MHCIFWTPDGVSLFLTPTGEVYLHHHMQQVLIGPLPDRDEAMGIARANKWLN